MIMSYAQEQEQEQEQERLITEVLNVPEFRLAAAFQTPEFLRIQLHQFEVCHFKGINPGGGSVV